MKKIAIIGCCYSRDPFNSKFTDYKKDLAVSSEYFQSSLISLMQKPCTEKLLSIVDVEQKMVIQELKRELLPMIASNKPDYILVDFFTDLRFGIILDDVFGIRTNNIGKFNSSIFDNDGFELNIRSNKEMFLTYYKYAVYELYLYMKKNKIESSIIINKINFANYYTKAENHEKVYFQNREYYTKLFTQQVELEKIWYEIFGTQVITTISTNQDFRFEGDEKYPLSIPANTHFVNEYYTSFINEIRNVIMAT